MVHLTLQYLKLPRFVELELFMRQFIMSRLIFIGQLAEDVCSHLGVVLQENRAITSGAVDRELIAIRIMQEFISHQDVCEERHHSGNQCLPVGQEQLPEPLVCGPCWEMFTDRREFINAESSAPHKP